jgi:hypothetical protein
MQCIRTLAVQAFVIVIFLLLGCSGSIAADPVAKSPQKAKLQIFNGSENEIQIAWVADDGSQKPTTTIAPRSNEIINTTVGHTHVVLSSQGDELGRTTCVVPIQAYRFERPGQIDIATDNHPWPHDTILKVVPEMNVPNYYDKIIFAKGFPIVGSQRVDRFALSEAAYLMDCMLSQRPDVRSSLIHSGARLCIMSEDEFTTDLPEFSQLANQSPMPGIDGRDFWDARARGLGGSETDPYCSCAEENLLAFAGDPYSTENILIHEFAHNMHLRGLANIDPTFDQRLEKSYRTAMANGLWKGKYASVNRQEYFAEGVQSWFDDNREFDHDHNHVNTREELVEYDPGLADLCREVFGSTELKYTKPTTRLVDHMEGYDPTNAGQFKWPPRLLNAQQAIRQSAEQRNQKANEGAATEQKYTK